MSFANLFDNSQTPAQLRAYVIGLDDSTLAALVSYEVKSNCSVLGVIAQGSKASEFEDVLSALSTNVTLSVSNVNGLLHTTKDISMDYHPIMLCYLNYGIRLARSYISHYYAGDTSLLSTKDSKGKSILDYDTTIRSSYISMLP